MCKHRFVCKKCGNKVCVKRCSGCFFSKNLDNHEYCLNCSYCYVCYYL